MENLSTIVDPSVIASAEALRRDFERGPLLPGFVHVPRFLRPEVAEALHRACVEGAYATYSVHSPSGDGTELVSGFGEPREGSHRYRDLLDAAPVLRRDELSVFGEEWARWLGDPLTEHVQLTDGDVCAGYLDRVEAVDAYEAPAFLAGGWAYDRERSRGASRILLVDDAERIVGYAVGGQRRADVVEVVDAISDEYTGFVGHVGDISAARATIRAYALLSGSRACPLQSEQVIVRATALERVLTLDGRENRARTR